MFKYTTKYDDDNSKDDVQYQLLFTWSSWWHLNAKQRNSEQKINKKKSNRRHYSVDVVYKDP